MGLNIKDREVQELAAEAARLAHARVGTPAERGGLREYLEESVRPHVPAAELGRTVSREEEEEILGYGRDGF